MRELIALAVLPLAACATVPAQEVAIAGAGECLNEGLDRFVGQPATAELARELLQLSGAKTVQWIQPGMMVTMDYRSDRLRITLDTGNRVERARCG